MRILSGVVLGLMLSGTAMANDFFMMSPPATGAPATQLPTGYSQDVSDGMYGARVTDVEGELVSVNMAFAGSGNNRRVEAVGPCVAINESSLCVQAQRNVARGEVWDLWIDGALVTPPDTTDGGDFAAGGSATQAQAAAHKYLQSSTSLAACTRSNSSATPCAGLSINAKNEFCKVCDQVRARAYSKGWSYQWAAADVFGWNFAEHTAGDGAHCTQDAYSGGGCACQAGSTTCDTWNDAEDNQ